MRAEQVRQIVGPDFWDPSDPAMSLAAVRGQPAVIHQWDGDDGGSDLALSWQSDGCFYTVLFARGKSLADAVKFAARY